MKITKFIVLLVIILFSALLANHHKMKLKHKLKLQNKVWDDSISPSIVRDVMDMSIEKDKDELKLYSPCMDLILKKPDFDQARRKLWAQLETFATSEKYILNSEALIEFLKETNSQVSIDNDKTNQKWCGDYINAFLKTKFARSTQNPYLIGLKNLLRTSLGVYISKTRDTQKTLITSFAGPYRNNPIRANNMFSRLNGKSIEG